MKEKNYNLELIRMISFIFVIVIHVSNYYCRAYGDITIGEYSFSLLLNLLARISVPCFFMITGALLLGRQESLHKHAKRIFRFLIVLLVWSVIYMIWNAVYMKDPYQIKDLLYKPVEQHLWYLYAMIPIYLVLPFFQVMCKGMNLRMERAFLVVITAAVLFNYISTFFDEKMYYSVPMVGDRIYSYYVFIGYYIYKYRKHVMKGKMIPAGIFVVCMALNYGLTYAATWQDGEHYARLLEYGNPLLALAATMAFLMLVRLKKSEFNPSEQAKKWIDRFCGCSFGIYLIHIMFLDVYKRNIKPETFSAWIMIPVVSVGLVLLSFGCVWLIRKTKTGRKIM